MSDLEPPWFVMKRGKRKKAPKLETVNRLAKAMMINDGLYSIFKWLKSLYLMLSDIVIFRNFYNLLKLKVFFEA